jgi:acyl-CoA ligase (AMP-forming) (exosortase A-associated)
MTAIPVLLHDLIALQAEQRPDAIAIRFQKESLSYASLAQQTLSIAQGLGELGLSRYERVAIFLPKRPETVIALFATSLANGVFVPINPLLKPEQVAYLLRDCNVRVLITSRTRAESLLPELANCHDLHSLVLIDVDDTNRERCHHLQALNWHSLLTTAQRSLPSPGIDTNMVAILYTSGSTGKPKGVVLSHRNLLTGAQSVTEYLGNHSEDRLLAVLPFSFDYGLSQLTTAFSVGARVVLMDYLVARDVITTVEREGITGLAAVPTLWIQLAQLPWPETAKQTLRYITNSGGAMPRTILTALRQALPNTQIYLMYGLTEAFRSTYLPPSELERRPDSIGRAIPNAEILVVREDGSLCGPGEPGELVHRGSLVTLGYWNAPEQTAQRFRPVPDQPQGLPLPEIAVWSGDTGRMDEEGFFYFIGRQDDTIKTSGYRVSPTEVEEVLYSSGSVAEAAALGIRHPLLGQAVVAVVKPLAASFEAADLMTHCKRHLPNFMVPLRIITRQTLPYNPNGKLDRKQLASELTDLFQETAE